MTQWDQKTRKTRRPRRIEEANSAEVGFPVAWVIIGALSGLLVIGLVGLGVVNILRKQSIVTPTPSSVPGVAATQSTEETPVSGSSSSEATPTLPPVVTLEPTPTSPPTVTPVPTVPAALAPSVYAKIINTGDSGVSMRAGPGTNNARTNVAPEGSIVLILDGPKADENQAEYVWWYIRDDENNEGWAVQDFLEPSLPPEAIDN